MTIIDACDRDIRLSQLLLDSRWRIAIKWHSNGLRIEGREERAEGSGSFIQGNYCVAPWYSREELLPGSEPELKRSISRFVSTQIAHYPTDEIAATQPLDLDSLRGYCTFPALIGREFAHPLCREPPTPADRPVTFFLRVAIILTARNFRG